MHGNVSEWCHDWWTDSLHGGIVVDPQGPGTGSNRVARGGFWYFIARLCRSAFRDYGDPDYGSGGLGFRAVLAPGQP
jgi:formylglycine-generating enzyme required for sulfatase activity